MRVQTLRLCLLVLLLGLALRHAPAAAEEAAPNPAQAYATAVKALAGPTAAESFAFTGVLRLNGKTMGYATLRAGLAAGHEGQWVTEDRFVIKGRAVPTVERSTARLTRQLELLAGTSSSTSPAKGALTWTRTAAGFEVVRPASEAEGTPEAATKTFAHKASALNTMAATLLFCRLALPAKAAYATTIFEVEAGMQGKPALQPVAIEVLGEQEIQGQKLWVVHARKGGKELTILFKPTTRDVVAVRIVEGKTTLEILPGDMWVMPAPDAVTAGMRGMFALSTGDMAVLDDVLHWPSLHAQELANAPPEKRSTSVDVERWRKNVLAGYAKHLTKRPAAMLQQLIKSGQAQIKQVKLTGGRVRVTFGPMMRNTQFVVAPVDGVWHVVEQPGQPKPAAGK